MGERGKGRPGRGRGGDGRNGRGRTAGGVGDREEQDSAVGLLRQRSKPLCQWVSLQDKERPAAEGVRGLGGGRDPATEFHRPGQWGAEQRPTAVPPTVISATGWGRRGAEAAVGMSLR